MRVDVSKRAESMRSPHQLTRLGAYVVCNNAGVSPLGAVWGTRAADWQWILGVNLWGVIHGVRAFAPRLIAQDEGHIVNTASVAGLISPPGSGAYNVTKHAVVALSESLHHDLRERDSRGRRVGAVPGLRPTGIVDSERNRPKDFRLRQIPRDPGEEAMLRKAVDLGQDLRRPGGAGGGRGGEGGALLHPHAPAHQGRDPGAHGRHARRARAAQPAGLAL